MNRLMAIQNPNQYTHEFVSVTIDTNFYMASPNLRELPPNSALLVSDLELRKDPNIRFCHESVTQHADRLTMLHHLTNEHLMYFVYVARSQPDSQNTPEKSQEVITYIF